MDENYQLGLFMDLTQFEELEKKIVGLLDRQEKVIAENTELRNRVSALEEKVQSLNLDNQKLTSQREELLNNQRDKKKEEQIRHKVVDLLQKLEGLEI
jgi:chromosome segregation ATPase